MKRILDLGCGTVKVEGAVGLDNTDLHGVDIIHDLLLFPYPIQDESFDIIYLRNVLEHFDFKQINDIMNECFRILISGELLRIHVPHVFSISAFIDPTHKSYFTFGSMQFWDLKNSKEYYKIIDNNWKVINTKADVVWFNWKGYQARKLDKLFSKYLAIRISKAIGDNNNPSLADRLIMKYNTHYTGILWELQKI